MNDVGYVVSWNFKYTFNNINVMKKVQGVNLLLGYNTVGIYPTQNFYMMRSSKITMEEIRKLRAVKAECLGGKNRAEILEDSRNKGGELWKQILDLQEILKCFIV